MKLPSIFFTFFKLVAFASTAGGLRTCAGALFASFEKYASHFSNHAFGVTEPNNAPNTGTDRNQAGEVCVPATRF